MNVLSPTRPLVRPATSSLIRQALETGDFDPDSQDYFDRLVANGSSISTSSQLAVDTFIRSLKSAGLWTLLREVGLLMGPDDLNGALVKLKYVSGVGTFANTGFVNGDYTPAGAAPGIKGNGSTKYLDWGATAVSMLSTQYLGATIALPTIVTATAGTRYYQGANGANGASVCNLRRSSTQVVGNIYTSVALIKSTPPIAGNVYIANHSGSEYVLYENGVSVNSNTPGSGNNATTNHRAFCNNNNGTNASYTDDTIAFLAVADPFAATQAADFSDILLQLLADLAS